jgi:hypothetical protein
MACVNIVPNPSLETDDSDWTLAASFTRNNDTAQHGSWAIKFSGTSQNTDSRTALIAASPNTQYTVSGYIYRASGFSGNTSIDWLEYDSGESQLVDGGNTQVTDTDTWTRVSATFTTNASTAFIRVRFVCDNTATGTAYGDAFQLETGATATDFCDPTSALEVRVQPGIQEKVGPKIIG